MALEYRSTVTLTQEDIDRRAVDHLMQLDPEAALESLAAVEDTGFQEEWRVFQREHRLRQAHAAHILRPADLGHTCSLIATTLRSVARDTQLLVMRVRRLNTATKLIQAFVRESLASLKERRTAVVDKWMQEQELARGRIRSEIAAAKEKGRSSVAAMRQSEQLWQLFMDCWIDRGSVEAAVDRLWLDRRHHWLAHFRAWRHNAVLDRRARYPFEAVTARHNAERAVALHYHGPRFGTSSVTVGDIAGQLLLIHLHREVRRARPARSKYPGGSRRQSFGPGRRDSRTDIPAPSALRGPGSRRASLKDRGVTVGSAEDSLASSLAVDPSDGRLEPEFLGAHDSDLAPPIDPTPPLSYTHALMLFDTRNMHTALYLRRMWTGERVPAEAPSNVIGRQLTDARAIYARWVGGDAAPGLGETGTKKPTIGRDGQPISAYGFEGTIPSSATPEGTPKIPVLATAGLGAAGQGTSVSSRPPPASGTRRLSTRASTTRLPRPPSRSLLADVEAEEELQRVVRTTAPQPASSAVRAASQNSGTNAFLRGRASIVPGRVVPGAGPRTTTAQGVRATERHKSLPSITPPQPSMQARRQTVASSGLDRILSDAAGPSVGQAPPTRGASRSSQLRRSILLGRR